MGRQEDMFLLFVAVLCKVMIAPVAAGILVLPLGVTRELVCSSPPEPGYGIVWHVNGTSAASSQPPYIALGEEVQSGDGGVQRNITFTAHIRANNTHLRCIVSSFRGDSHISVDLNLILQGLVPPPTVTYEMSMGHHSVIIFWSAPFTLNISDMEPDILHYVVYIIRDDGYNDTVKTTDTQYVLQVPPCRSHQYLVEIATVNIVGEGEKFTSQELPLKGYAVAVVSDTTVSFRNEMVVIEMTVEVSPHCHEVGVVNYEVELNATYSGDRLLFNSSGDVRKHTMILTSPNIRMNELYDYSVRIEGLSNSQSIGMNLSTFDAQYVNDIGYESENNVILIVIIISSSILMAVILTLVLSIIWCKHKGKKYVPSSIEQNDYYDPRSVQVPPFQPLSSESSSSPEAFSGSDSLEQSIGSPLVLESVHTHCPMTRPPPTWTTEPVKYATILHQDMTTHSKQVQGTMNGQLPGPHTTDDNN